MPDDGRAATRPEGTSITPPQATCGTSPVSMFIHMSPVAEIGRYEKVKKRDKTRSSMKRPAICSSLAMAAC